SRRDRRMATYQLYRNTTVGQALQQTLNDFQAEDIISRALAERVMATFDKVINKTLNTKAKNKMNFKAEKLRAYRFCDNVWTFVMEKVEFREAITAPKERLKIVACDGSNKTIVATTAVNA
ncbi:hypothetical protein PMAYCL1PPCAC_13486, partial [Pristionchus mayeri]